MILTVAAPLQTATTQPAATKADIQLLVELSKDLNYIAKLEKQIDEQEDTITELMKSVTDAGLDNAKMLAKVAVQEQTIATLKETLDKIEPDGLTVLDRIDSIYNRILVSCFALFAVIGIVIPYLFRRADTAALRSAQDAAKIADKKLRQIVTSADEIDQRLNSVEQELRRDITQGLLVARAELNFTFGQLGDIPDPVRITMLITATSCFQLADKIEAAVHPIEGLLEIPAIALYSLDSVPRPLLTAMDNVIRAFEQDPDNNLPPGTLQELRDWWARYDPNTHTTTRGAGAAKAPDDE